MREQQPLTGREKVLVQAITAALNLLLAEIDSKLDALSRKADAIMAHQRQPRPRPRAIKPCTQARTRTLRARSCRKPGRH